MLAALGFGFEAGWALTLVTAAVTALTLASVALYLREWVQHMGAHLDPVIERAGRRRGTR